MSRPRYEEVDHPSDICIRVYGDTVSEIFSNAAFAIFDIQYDLAHVSPEVFRVIGVTAPDAEVALVRFLSEILYISETESLVFREFDTRVEDQDGGVNVRCSMKGCRFNPALHRKGILIKAIAYNLRVDMEKKEAIIVLDT